MVIRVKTHAEDGYQTVTVRKGFSGRPNWLVETPTGPWSVHCDCEARQYSGHDYCSHIEAPLLAGERAMVHEDDRGVADEAMKLIGPYLKAPETWKGSWRKNLRWRGLQCAERKRRQFDGRPVVCFTGAMEKPRKVMAAEADGLGWDVIDNPHSEIDVLVAADPTGNSSKLKFARAKAIPILNLEEWAMMIDTVPPPSAQEGGMEDF